MNSTSVGRSSGDALVTNSSFKVTGEATITGFAYLYEIETVILDTAPDAKTKSILESC